MTKKKEVKIKERLQFTDGEFWKWKYKLENMMHKKSKAESFKKLIDMHTLKIENESLKKTIVVFQKESVQREYELGHREYELYLNELKESGLNIKGKTINEDNFCIHPEEA